MFRPSVKSQPLASQYFQRAFASERLAHAYLFWGPQGSDKLSFALEVAKAVHCDEGEPCGACAVCRSVDHGNDPSVHVFGPTEELSVVSIETVRALCERLQFKSQRMHVAILRCAELLGEAAANALLKTLEEPPPGTLLILTSQSTGSLPMTIVSRCHRVPFVLEASRSHDAVETTLAMVSELRRPDFLIRHEPRTWLSQTFPQSSTRRDAVRELLERLVFYYRGECERFEDGKLDGPLERLELLLDLSRALEGNVQADLVFEALLAGLRR